MPDFSQNNAQNIPLDKFRTQNTTPQPRTIQKSFSEEKQTYLLEEILETQKNILKIEKSRLNTSRLKFVTLTIKFLAILWFMWAGFTQMKDFTENLFEKFMNPQNMISQLGNFGNKKSSTENILKNSGEIDFNNALNSLSGLLGK